MLRSATEAWITYVALLVFFPACLVIRKFALSSSWYLTAAAAVPAVVIVGLEAVFTQPAARLEQRFQFQRWKPVPSAIAYKAIGLAAVVGSIGCAQWVVSEYSKDFYRLWVDLVVDVGPLAGLVCILYIAVADGYQTDEARQEDLYHNLGRLLLRRPSATSSGTITQSRWAGFVREWLVKAFFLPLMTTAYAHSFMAFDNTIERLKELVAAGGLAPGPIYSTLHDAIYLVDVVWATFGYMLSCTLFDSHIRSVEPTILGWAAALVCYQPFNASVVDAYFTYGGPSNNWQDYLADAPNWCKALWGGSVLLLISVYTWSTVVFGLRFSNLTNRGIITSGPYSFTRHPAYIAKNLSWWLVNVPWSLHDGVQMAFKRCARLVAINGLYALRAWTEEQHLLRDPTYVEYYNSIQQRYGLPLKRTPQQQGQQQQQPHQPL